MTLFAYPKYKPFGVEWVGRSVGGRRSCGAAWNAECVWFGRSLALRVNPLARVLEETP